jgi:signal transduction histidine kinase
MTLGSRTLVAICGVLVALLAGLAAVQYRWSTRVAAADAQREREHLESAASLFANQFNDMVAQTTSFLQNDAWNAFQSHERLATPPKVISELFYVDLSDQRAPKAQRLNGSGSFETASLPSWISIAHCSTGVIERPPALVTPVYDLAKAQYRRMGDIRVQTMITRRLDRCFVARLNEGYLRDTFFPQLIRQSFGDTAAREYAFAVASRRQPMQAIYGAAGRADLKKPFFALSPQALGFLKRLPAPGEAPKRNTFFVQNLESRVVIAGGPDIADFLGTGIWELSVAHKGVPLGVAFEQTRWRNLLLSVGVECLLVAAIAFLVIAARRMQQLANRQMQFVAGVSHELRTPVSAISMLSRNQADGLVTGVDKVKRYGELIHQQSQRLNEMVEQTLQYAGIHSGLRRAPRNEVDLTRLIEEAVAARRDGLSQLGFEIELAIDPDLPKAPGDEKLLRIAFDNLLSNAQKYAESGRWIRVSARYDAAEKEALISVEDHGVGIDPAEQAEIFEPFCRGQAATEAQIPGSGLGLSLVRSAAEAHRGAVTLRSERGRGSTFTMHLPV